MMLAKEEPIRQISIPSAGRLALVFSNIILVIGILAIAPALPTIEAACGGASGGIIGAPLVGSVAGFTFALTSVLFGSLPKRVGYRRAMVCSLATIAAFGLAGGAWANMPFILLMRGVVGIAVAIYINAALFAVGSVLPEPERGNMLGLIALVGSIGGVLLFPLVGELSQINWRLSFAPHIMALIMMPMVKKLPTVPGIVTNIGAKARWLGFDLVGAAMLTGVSLFIVGIFGALYLSQIGVRSPMILSLPAMVATVATTLGSAVYIKTSRFATLDAHFALAQLCFASGLSIIGLTRDIPVFLVGIFIAAFGSGIFGPNLNAAAIARAPQNPGPGLGVANGILFGSMILFPLIAVPLTGWLGGIDHAFVDMGFLCLVAGSSFAVRAGLRRLQARPAAV